MKTTLLLLAVFLTACASPNAIIDGHNYRCGPGQDIEIRAGVLDPTSNLEAAGPLTYIVEIANNSHHDVTVESIRLEPTGEYMQQRGTIFRKLDELIPEGKEHVFELSANDVWLTLDGLDRAFDRRRLEFAASVRLSNGDSYRCAFAMIARK